MKDSPGTGELPKLVKCLLHKHDVSLIPSAHIKGQASKLVISVPGRQTQEFAGHPV